MMQSGIAKSADAALCAAITRRHARTFTLASRFLPEEKRRAGFAVYAFCRIADDYVDEAANGAMDAEASLDKHSRAFHAALAGGETTPVFRELMWAMGRYNIPVAPFDALVEMLRHDLTPVHYETWLELEQYCEGVASTVGEMCAFVFGIPSAPAARAEALQRARTLGVALQLTNILRDVGEDAGRNRCYLPSEDLARFGMTRSDILERRISPRDFRWQEFMQFLIARARRLYEIAEPGLRMLDHDSQCCATICASGYAGILDAIARRQFDSLSGRAHIGVGRKALVIFDAWRVTRSVANFYTARPAPVEHVASVQL